MKAALSVASRAALLCVAAALSACPDPAAPAPSNLDEPGPVAFTCVCEGAAAPLDRCATGETCPGAYRVHVVQRFRSTLVAIDAPLQGIYDLDPSAPGANGLRLPGQALALATAPSGVAVYAVSEPGFLSRVPACAADDDPRRVIPATGCSLVGSLLPEDSIELPEAGAHLIAAGADDATELYLLNLPGDAIHRITLTEPDLAGATIAPLAPAPPEPFAALTRAGDRLAGISQDGRRIYHLADGAAAWEALGLDAACADGLDNDGDGLTDGQDPNCASAGGDDEAADGAGAACSNGADDDGDGLTDLDDPGCRSAHDPSESSDALPCDDGLDNDGDGLADVDGCTPDALAFDRHPCTDGLDNNGDGLVDGEDKACKGAGVELPHAAPCGNGADDDGDGLLDFPFDAACVGSDDVAEGRPACSDGIDNDGDGLTDAALTSGGAPGDPDCYGPADDSERGVPRLGLPLLAAHPRGPVAYALRAGQRDVVAVDLAAGEILRCHAGHEVWDRQRVTETRLDDIPAGMALALVDDLRSLGDEVGELGPADPDAEVSYTPGAVVCSGGRSANLPDDRLRTLGFILTRSGQLQRYDADAQHLDNDLDRASAAQVAAPSLRREGNLVDIRFDLPRRAAHLGTVRVDDSRGGFQGVQLLDVNGDPADWEDPDLELPDAQLPTEIWTLTSGGVIPTTERRSGAIQQVSGRFTDPGARFCDAGVEPGDVIEITPAPIPLVEEDEDDPDAEPTAPPPAIACGLLIGDAFRVDVTAVDGETLSFDPSTLQVRRATITSDGEFERFRPRLADGSCPAGQRDGVLLLGEPRDPICRDGAFTCASGDVPFNDACGCGCALRVLSPACLAGPLRYRVRAPADQFLVVGSETGLLHPWAQGSGRCERTTDDPRWASRASIGEVIDPAIESCPIQADSPSVRLRPFRNPFFELAFVPGCERDPLGSRAVDTPIDTTYRFTLNGGIRSSSVRTGNVPVSVSVGATIAAPPGGRFAVIVDEGAERVFFLDPRTSRITGDVF